METGYQGTFVTAWSQTEIDGFRAASLASLRVGATWSWQGEALCVDGPQDVLRLGRSDQNESQRQRAARSVRKLVGTALELGAKAATALTCSPDTSFVVTDGVRSYDVTLIETGDAARPLLMFLGQLPPRDTDLWIVNLSVEPGHRLDAQDDEPGVICFTPGTLINTPAGPRPVETLREGDMVATRDNGPQEVLWTGARRMSGARLYAMPKLRPVRIHAHAFGDQMPETSFLVSPQHRMLLRGAEVDGLFNTPEVLVRAADLTGTPMAEIDLCLREVTYVHLLLPKHEILWANGLETESFHPASADLSTLDDADRARLIAGLPEVEHNPRGYGDYARRNLTASEVAVLKHHVA